ESSPEFAGFRPICGRCYAGGVRGTEILFSSSVALALALLGTTIGCKSESAAEPRPGAEATPPKAEARPEREAKLDSSDAPAPAPKPDPARADKLADLDALCKALDHDYDDGTLSDYYADVQPRTEWGKAQREAGNESIQPGRLLEKAVAELSPGAEDPALEHCRKLLDYLDDVE
ncbi:MAG: hypothetical protein R6X02_02555, partial [Enhygromyxa sp.]